jgi:hypothetical protein
MYEMGISKYRYNYNTRRLGEFIMEFNNMEELIDYIDDHSSFMTE